MQVGEYDWGYGSGVVVAKGPTAGILLLRGNGGEPAVGAQVRT